MKKLFLPVITAIFFSGSFIAAKYTTFDLGPLTTSFLRYVVAFIFLALLISHYKKDSLKIKKEDVPKLVLLGLFGITGYHFFFFSSLKYTLVTNTGIINASSPVVTGLMAAIFIKERLTKKNYIGIILAFLGVLILITKGEIETFTNLNFNYGDMLMLLAVVSWVVYSLIIKSLSKKYSSFTLTFYATLWGVIMLLFFALAEGGAEQVQTISLRSVLSLLYMGIFASGIGYLFYNYGIHELGPTKTSSLVYSIVPIFVAILSFIFFAEGLTCPMIISVVLIIAGLNLALSKIQESEIKLTKP